MNPGQRVMLFCLLPGGNAKMAVWFLRLPFGNGLRWIPTRHWGRSVRADPVARVSTRLKT